MESKERYYSFNCYLRSIFGERVQKISVNAGFGCPNLNGELSQDGCIYCSNNGFGLYAESTKSVEQQIKESIKFYEKRSGVRKFILYFQSFTNTYADLNVLRQRYDIIYKFPQIVGLFIATRPDCVDEEKVKLIADYQKKYLVWLEYGLQTTDDSILKAINRNHTYNDFLKALSLARKYKINVGLHLILGLPQASYECMMNDAFNISQLDIQGVKFHVLHVLRGARLEKIYKKDGIELLGLNEYVSVICDFLEKISSSVVILRMVSNAFKDFLIAPLWINRKTAVIEEINRELEKRNTYQGYYFRDTNQLQNS